MDNFLSNRRNVTISNDGSSSQDESVETTEHAFSNFNEEKQVLLEGDSELPRVETILEDKAVKKIVITMPDGRRLELDCIY